MIGRVLGDGDGSCRTGSVSGVGRRGTHIMFDVLEQSERTLLIAMNGEPHFKELDDIGLLCMLPEKLIVSTLGNNERTNELLKIRKENELEF